MDSNIIKKLREDTGAGVLACQEALKQSDNNWAKALEILRKKGQKISHAKGARKISEGVIDAYIHSNQKMGAMVALGCETDFVARNQEFRELAHDIAMQVAATNPLWINSQEVPQNVIEKEKEIYRQALDPNTKKDVQDKIINGKLQKFYSEVCLLNQLFIKDNSISIEELLQKKIAVLGENIGVRQFVRFSL